MTPPDSIKTKGISLKQREDDSESSFRQEFPETGRIGRSFPEKSYIAFLLIVGAFLVYGFVKFLERDVTQNLHYTKQPIYVEPAGY